MNKAISEGILFRAFGERAASSGRKIRRTYDVVGFK